MRAKVTLTDPTEVVEVDHDARDRRAAEVSFAAVVKAKPGTPMKQLMEAFPESWITWVCWHAAHRQQVTSLTWAQWSERALEAESVDEDAEVLPDPTGAAT